MFLQFVCIFITKKKRTNKQPTKVNSATKIHSRKQKSKYRRNKTSWGWRHSSGLAQFQLSFQSSCHLPFCPLSDCLLLNNTVEWIIWISDIKSSCKRNQRTLHCVPIEAKPVSESADWLDWWTTNLANLTTFDK